MLPTVRPAAAAIAAAIFGVAAGATVTTAALDDPPPAASAPPPPSATAILADLDTGAVALGLTDPQVELTWDAGPGGAVAACRRIVAAYTPWPVAVTVVDVDGRQIAAGIGGTCSPTG